MPGQTFEPRETATNLSYPTFNPAVNPNPSSMPPLWSCTALLHPFSPPPGDNPQPDTPFFQLCLADIVYIENQVMSIQVKGELFGTWWYKITPAGTSLSTDEGATWQTVDMGWTFPGTQWLSNSICVGSSYLNWMQAQMLDWWKTPVPNSNASTWFWLNTSGNNANLPFRMMFGQAPPSPTKGDPAQLAFFQMFSFTYLVDWTLSNVIEPLQWFDPAIDGFSFGNVPGYKKFIWNRNFGMTVFMTPVDEKSSPLPTRVLYTWKPDADYQVNTDRAQNTLMWYMYNAGNPLLNEEALLFGICPSTINPPPPNSGTGFLIDTDTNGEVKCTSMPFGCEPPDWTYVPGVQGTIHATISSNPELSPGQPMMLVSVLFPPTNEYPQGRFLWTWYSPLTPDGLKARPVTFMESASNIEEGGTSLALADYFDYQEYSGGWLPPSDFQIPSACNGVK